MVFFLDCQIFDKESKFIENVYTSRLLKNIV